jgi:hypothetical protein
MGSSGSSSARDCWGMGSLAIVFAGVAVVGRLTAGAKEKRVSAAAACAIGWIESSAAAALAAGAFSKVAGASGCSATPLTKDPYSLAPDSTLTTAFAASS